MKNIDLYSLVAILSALLFLAGAHLQSNFSYSMLHLIAALSIGFCLYNFFRLDKKNKIEV
jgi:hypothetical protein